MDFDKLARHDVQLNRLVTGLLNANIYPTFEEAYKDIRAILLDAQQITSKKQLDAVQKAIDAAVYEPTRKAWDKVQTEMEDLAVYENEYQSEYYAAIAATVGANAVVLASPEDKVRSYVNRAVMALASGDNVTTGTFGEFIGRHIDKEMTGIKNQIVLGYINGIPTNDVIENINRLLTGTIKRDAEGLARTGLSAYANAATELMAQDNKDVIEYRVFSATLDSRTTLGCAALDRKKWRMDDKSYPTLPRHFRCLTPDAFVSTSASISYISKRPYNGKVVTIKSAAGNILTVTPNHPIMTINGFVAAKEIKKGDKLVTNIFSENAVFTSNNDDMKTTIGDRFESALSSGKMLPCPVPSTTEDFHNDVIIENEVSIILLNIELADSFIPAIAHRFVERFLKVTGTRGLIDESCFSLFDEFVKANFSTLGGNIGVSSERLNLFIRSIIHSGLLLLTSIPRLDSGVEHYFSNRIGGDGKSFSDTANTDTGVMKLGNLINTDMIADKLSRSVNPISFESVCDKTFAEPELVSDFRNFDTTRMQTDDCVDVVFGWFDGHVYNLETENNIYTANNIIVHNCRSRYVFTVDGQDGKFDGDRPSKGDDITQVSANTNYEQFLKRQSPEFVRDVLGVKRAQLFLSGELRLSQFVDMVGNPLTLAELKARDLID